MVAKVFCQCNKGDTFANAQSTCGRPVLFLFYLLFRPTRFDPCHWLKFIEQPIRMRKIYSNIS